MESLRWGIIGAGNIANQFVAGLYSSKGIKPMLWLRGLKIRQNDSPRIGS